MAMVQRYSTKPNPKRLAVFQYIKNNPGTHFSRIKRALDIESGVLQYHITVLLRNGAVECRSEGNRKLYFPNNQAQEDGHDRVRIVQMVRQRFFLLSEKEQLLLRTLVLEGPVTIQHLAETIQIRFPRHVKPYIRSIEAKMGIVIWLERRGDQVYCGVDLERYREPET